MTHTFLIEIGLEEMPSRFIQTSIEQFKTRMAAFLDNKKVPYEEIKVFSTPRRLALLVTGLAEKQEDQTDIIKGPSKKAGVDAEGNLTKAAQGFARSKQIDPDSLYVEEVNGVPYLFAKKETKGVLTKDMLPEVATLIEDMDFPISMHWADHSFKYIRPVHWIVALLDETVIPVTALGIESGRTTRGHRFLGKEVTLDKAVDYEETLKHEYVIADRAERKQTIQNQIEHLEKEQGWVVPENPSLLNEVTDMVEFPTTFFGTFNAAYLKVPEEALVTSMRDHQRYFDVRDASGEILPYFVAVRNGTADALDVVRKGNEKVLRARLADAVFFFEDDLTRSIDDSLAKLKRVTFYEGMGSLYDKSVRVQKIAELIGELVGLDTQQTHQVKRAAEIAKFDLVTNMVDEFPELQGIMGEIYAKEKGEDKAVAQAIREQYLPLSSKGSLPESTVGSVLAIAEKLDTLFMFFQAGVIPTGSNDPFALRRQAYGLVRIVLENDWTFPVQKIIKALSESILTIDSTYSEKLERFFISRLNQYFMEQGWRYDVIEAVLTSNQQDIFELEETAYVLQSHLSDSNFKLVMEALTRVLTLAEKASNELDKQAIDPALFETDSEKQLYENTMAALDKLEHTTHKETIYTTLSHLQEPIAAFFEDNMVMADDDAIRTNRLTLLKKIGLLVNRFADVRKLVIK